jgi:amino acid adenylation domain-containing protein
VLFGESRVKEDFHMEADRRISSSPENAPLSTAANRTSAKSPQVRPNSLNLPEAEMASVQSIPALLDVSFSAMPLQPAAEFLGAVLSRSELADRSDRLASWLIENGAGQGSLVGIYMERSIEMLISVLGVLKAGAAYVPLDPTFPRLRIEQILGETKVPVLLTVARHQQNLHASDTRIFCMDDQAGALQSVQLQRLPAIRPAMRAYVIFTSGSTGVPKGVEVSHGSVVNLLISARELLEIGPQDRLFAITTLAFDISVLELLLPLISGGTVIIGSKDVVGDGKALMEQLAVSRATVLQATPVTFRMLLESEFRPPPGFKMLCGGEAWTLAMAERLLALGARVWNMYGPTETTVWSSITEVRQGETRLTIGPPIANTRFYVVDERLQPVPAGGQGELLIGGAGVALGYFHRDSLTAEKFLSDPDVPGERMYRTGDEVRQVVGGRLEFIGRLDQQVKLRGHRIELGEIETAMMACEGIRDQVATLRKDDSGEPFLVGFYTAANDIAPSVLRESLAQRLPAYMIPRHFERLDAFPLTPNGKTDRRSLASYPLTTKSPDAAANAETVSATEMEMAHMWRKLFEEQPITPDSDFFELGGDSLLLVRLQSMISRKFGVRLEAVDITNHFTLSKLARWVEQRQAAGRDPEKMPFSDPRVLPLQKSGTGYPIFILPQMMLFRTLAEELGTEQPVYAVQMIDEDVPKEMDSANMEELARLYIGLIRKIQRSGPYRLGGWCLWGWMAYEVARLLEEQGEVVEVLVIVDALAPGFWDRYSKPRQLLMKMSQLAHRLAWFLIRFWRVNFTHKGQDRLRLLRTLSISMVSMLPSRFRPEDYATETMRIEQVAVEAARRYKPSPVKANVLLFTSEVRPIGPLMGNDMGWGAVLGRPVHLNSLPGNHTEIFHPPAARIMAALLREALGSKSEAVSGT